MIFFILFFSFFFFFFFFFNDTATTEIYTVMNTLSLHDALPICSSAMIFYWRIAASIIRRADQRQFISGGGTDQSEGRAPRLRFHPCSDLIRTRVQPWFVPLHDQLLLADQVGHHRTRLAFLWHDKPLDRVQFLRTEPADPRELDCHSPRFVHGQRQLAELIHRLASPDS